MPDLITPWWTELKGVIAATWTDVLPANNGGGVAEVVALQKVNWQRVAVPYAPVLYTDAPWEDSPVTAQVHEVTAEIFYVRADGSGTLAAIRAKLAALDDALYAATFPNGIQFLDVLGYDVGESNPANQLFLELGQPYSAGSLVTQWLIGETFL
jgi:hypothetical protein